MSIFFPSLRFIFVKEPVDSTSSNKLECPKCGNHVTVDVDFGDQFYCHMCGTLMK